MEKTYTDDVFLRNFATLLPHYMLTQSKRYYFPQALLSEPQTSQGRRGSHYGMCSA
jgi:hypothetical protein